MNPKLAREAINARPTIVGGLKLQPLTLGMYLFLEEIGSPLIAPNPQAPPTARDLFTVLFVLTHPLADCWEAWERGDRAFMGTVIAWADTIAVPDLAALTEAITTHIGGAFAPAAATRPRTDGESEVLPLGGATAQTPSATDSAGHSH